ncbi:hypothetical protein GGI35DRAFT_3770 [Trichoderma velutinum]
MAMPMAIPPLPLCARVHALAPLLYGSHNSGGHVAISQTRFTHAADWGCEVCLPVPPVRGPSVLFSKPLGMLLGPRLLLLFCGDHLRGLAWGKRQMSRFPCCPMASF